MAELEMALSPFLAFTQRVNLPGSINRKLKSASDQQYLNVKPNTSEFFKDRWNKEFHQLPLVESHLQKKK